MTLTKAEIIEILSGQVGLTQQASKEVLAVFFDAITRSLGSGQDVKLRNFWRFQAVERRARKPRFPGETGIGRFHLKSSCASDAQNS